MPYFEIGSAEENVGMKNEVGATVVYAFGDGDVNFALGDGLESVVDGIFVSVENRTGWDTQGTYLGNYTDTWLGFGFFVDQLNVTLTAGPRFYSPGSYSGLSQRTDWGGEIRDGISTFRKCGVVWPLEAHLQHRGWNRLG